MKLSDKIRYLREVEGSLRGLDRAMTQQEIVRAIAESAAVAGTSGANRAAASHLQRDEAAAKMGRPVRGARKVASKKRPTISQSYLSQIESGARPHLTNTTRLLLARFFKVHPGYLVDDPEGYHAELMSDVRTVEDKLDLWLIAGAERFRRDPELCHALLALSRHEDSRRCLLLLESVLETPALVDRLMQVLRPAGLIRASVESLPQRQEPGIPLGSYGTAATPLIKAKPVGQASTALKGMSAGKRSKLSSAKKELQ